MWQSSLGTVDSFQLDKRIAQLPKSIGISDLQEVTTSSIKNYSI